MWIPKGSQYQILNNPATYQDADDRQDFLSLFNPSQLVHIWWKYNSFKWFNNGTFQGMLVSAVPGLAAAGAAYADLNNQMELMQAQITALSSAQTTLSSTVSTLSTSSTCLLSKVKRYPS